MFFTCYKYAIREMYWHIHCPDTMTLKFGLKLAELPVLGLFIPRLGYDFEPISFIRV